MTDRTPTTAAGRRTDAWLYLRAYLIGAVNGGLSQTVADSIIEYVDAIAAEARAPLEAERDLWKRDWAIKDKQWTDALEARAPLDVERLHDAMKAVEDHGRPLEATDYLAVAATYAALEEPTDD